MAPAQHSEARAADTMALWREVLDAMGRQDALGYLRRRCPDPQPAEALLTLLADEQSRLRQHLSALGPEDKDAEAVGPAVDAFFVSLQVQACRWTRLDGDRPMIWPWGSLLGAAAETMPPRRSLALLHETSRAILGELDLKRLLPLLADRAGALTHADVAFLALWDAATGTLEVVESRGLGPGLPRRWRPADDERRRLLEGDEARFVQANDAPWLGALMAMAPATGALVAPLRYQGAALGILVCAGGGVELGRREGAELLSLVANQTAIAIRNAAHYREVVQKAAALHAANDQLRGLDRMKDEFLATVSHELRTPLNFITGFGSILLDEQEGSLTEEQRYFIRNMMDGAFQLLALVNDLLDYSRIRSGKLPLNFVACDVRTLLGEAYELFRYQATELELQLEFHAPATLPRVHGDAQRLGQVLNNLLTNALKFTPAGGRVALSASVKDGHIRVEVADTGVGIRSDQIPLLFHRFSQLETGSTRQTGTGLGLAISKSLVDAHGGRIGVFSPASLEPGKGSVFWFTLPVLAE